MSEAIDPSAANEEEGYKPPPEFAEDTKEPLVNINLTNSTELWFTEWPNNQHPDFDGKELSLELHQDGKLGSFEDSSGARTVILNSTIPSVVEAEYPPLDRFVVMEMPQRVAIGVTNRDSYAARTVNLNRSRWLLRHCDYRAESSDEEDDEDDDHEDEWLQEEQRVQEYYANMLKDLKRRIEEYRAAKLMRKEKASSSTATTSSSAAAAATPLDTDDSSDDEESFRIDWRALKH